VGNTNVTRSLLYSFEPVTFTGARLTYAAIDQISLIIGVNNGRYYSDKTAAAGPDKTLEAGEAWFPAGMFSWSLQSYTGRDINKFGTTAPRTLRDTVATCGSPVGPKIYKGTVTFGVNRRRTSSWGSKAATITTMATPQ
jgi:Putative beta-barrel porin-2, OmpL-like. bbp2